MAGAGHVDVFDRMFGLGSRSRACAPHALTVPNFLSALCVVTETDLIAALPHQVAARHAARFDVRVVRAPLALTNFSIRAIVPKVAMLDVGVGWLLARLAEASRQRTSVQPKGRR